MFILILYGVDCILCFIIYLLYDLDILYFVNIYFLLCGCVFLYYVKILLCYVNVDVFGFLIICMLKVINIKEI